MKKSTLFAAFLTAFILLGLHNAGWAQLITSDNFNYLDNSLLTDNGWVAHSGGGTAPIAVGTSNGLIYNGYSGLTGITGVIEGNAAKLVNTGEDDSKVFVAPVTAGTIYFSFLTKITTGTAGYYLNLGGSASAFASRIFVKPSTTAGKINFGISNTSTAVYAATPTDFDPLTTYLIIVKYDVSTTGTVSMWIKDSGIPLTEVAAGSPEVTTSGTGQASIDRICLRQYSATQSIEVDGIRIGLTWTDIVSAAQADVTAPTFTATPTNGDIDVAINAPIVLIFDEAIRNIDDSEITDVNVASLLTLKETDASGVDVPFTATIDASKKIITATITAAMANSQAYYAAIAPVEDASNNATTLSSMTFTTVASTTPVLSDVTITETAPYYAGDVITINWVSQNITNVLIEAWIPSESKWDVLFASTASDGTETFPIPADAQYSAEYKLRISDIANPLVTAESALFTVNAVVNNLLSLRAQPVNAVVKYTGIATVTYARTAYNQKYIQDATAAILIHDPTTAPGFISGTYNIGDGITNIVGKISLYNQLIELVPTQPSGEPATGIEIVPEVRTLASLSQVDQSKLVKIENFAFLTPTQYDVDGKFVAAKSYDIDGVDKTVLAFRTAFAESDYIGGFVPTGPISSIVLVGQFNTLMQITPRSWSDMTVPTVADFNGTPTAILENDTVQFIDMSTNNPVSWEWTFEGGHPATSTDKSPFISYAAKGNYAVTLKVTNASGGTNTITKTDYINVGVLGISTLESAVTVYPNPTSDNLNISNPSNEKLEITILSLLGKPLKSIQASLGVTSVDLSDLPKGIYMIKMLNKTSKKVQMHKVLVK